MIHLDTNYLIALGVRNSPLRPKLEVWLRGRETVATSAVAWSEFLTGPVTTQQVRDISLLIQERIIPFGPVEAVLAARLYNEAGRKADLRVDSFIAASAISCSAALATQNRKDFLPFTFAGLRLI